MEAKKAEFFMILDGEPYKVKGAVFDYKGRLIGASTNETPFWALIDIKTGMFIGVFFDNPLDPDVKINIDELLENFDDIDCFYADSRARCAEKIKAAYDAEPDVKRQVFGEVENGNETS